jgi:hypothetical protein
MAKDNVKQKPDAYTFGVLIAYVISAIPVSLFREQSANSILIFLIFYCTTTAKMFLHWWTPHFDFPIATRFYPSPTLQLIVQSIQKEIPCTKEFFSIQKEI